MLRTVGYPTAVTDVDTTAVYPLGDLRLEYDATYGWRTWIYVLNGEASSAFAQGSIVARKTATVSAGTGLLAPVDSATARLLGVAQHAIAAGSYGWILKTGIGYVLADTGGYTADNGLIVGNAVAGRADNAAAVTNHCFAYAHASVSATATGLCSIFCP